LAIWALILAIIFLKILACAAFLRALCALALLFELFLRVDLLNPNDDFEPRDLLDLEFCDLLDLELRDLLDFDFLAPPVDRLELPPQPPPQVSGIAKHIIDKTNKKITVFRHMVTTRLSFLASRPRPQGIKSTRLQIGRRSNHAHYMPAFDESQPILFLN
jgi:hypothetical protein